MHYITIPKQIFAYTTISAESKIVYGVIYGLHKLKKKCIAENHTIALIASTSDRTVRRCISQLIKHKFIICHYVRNGKGIVVSRTITPLIPVHRFLPPNGQKWPIEEE